MTLAFIVRVEYDGSCWSLTLLDVTGGQRRRVDSFEGCLAAMREMSEARMLRGPRPRARSHPRR